MNGQKIYEYDLDITGMTDFGVSMEALMAGEAAMPPQGVRIDVAFAGRATGRLSGNVTGIDHLWMRPDGRIDLDIRGVIETDDGHRIALAAGGVAIPRADEPAADLAENVVLTTAAKEYEWVNTRQIWAVGVVTFTTGKIHIDAYMQ